MWYCHVMKRYGADSLREVGSPRRGDRRARTNFGRLGEASLPSVTDALHFIKIVACVPIDVWYSDGMKRHGANSLKEDGPCFGRPTPLSSALAGTEGRVMKRMRVVDFHDFSGYFWWVLMTGERDCAGRRVWRLAKHIPVCFVSAGAGRETHPAAAGTVALPMNRNSEHSRLFASIRGFPPVLESLESPYATR